MEFVSNKKTKEDFNNYINNLRTFSPNKGKKMNDTPNTTVDPIDNVGQNFYIDAEGNRVEIPFDVDGERKFYTSEGEAASAEATLFVAEDAADHPVTVH